MARATVAGMPTTERSVNLRCNIPDPQKKRLQKLQEEETKVRGRHYPLGLMVSKAIEAHYGIDAYGRMPGDDE